MNDKSKIAESLSELRDKFGIINAEYWTDEEVPDSILDRIIDAVAEHYVSIGKISVPVWVSEEFKRANKAEAKLAQINFLLNGK